ncbi:hypothetical protein OG21DRAFT_971992 [Imleria badia]|nr:hypothetical protein OG21DRAFT_971992 [Imleria badia]
MEIKDAPATGCQWGYIALSFTTCTANLMLNDYGVTQWNERQIANASAQRSVLSGEFGSHAPSMSSSRSAETTYEIQNDQRLDELHSKIRTLRGVTTDIYDDAERQNLTLDDAVSSSSPACPLSCVMTFGQGNTFSSFSSQLSHSSRRAAQAFGLAGAGGVRQTRIIMYVVGGFVAFWLLWKTKGFWWGSSGEA